MKSNAVIIAITLTLLFSSLAQGKNYPINISIFHPFSISKSENDSASLNLTLFYSRLRSINGCDLGGLITFLNDGAINMLAYASNLSAINTGAKFTVNDYYSQITIGGINLEKDINSSLISSFHIGRHFPQNKYHLDLDLGYIFLDNDKVFSSNKKDDQNAIQARVIAGFNITNRLILFGGIGLSYIYNADQYIDSGKGKPLLLGGIQLF